MPFPPVINPDSSEIPVGFRSIGEGMSRIEREVLQVQEKTKLLEYYRQMLAIRRMEEALAKAYSQGKIGGFLHLYIGQEAVAVGAIAALKPEDYVIATYREHGHAYAKGMSARAILAELYGKETGCSKGLGGSMHLFDANNNFLGGYGIVGGHVPIAAGVAFASKYRGDGRVTLCFFGEGAVSQGAFHEGLSLAALWKLPVVFICENNLYSMGTPLYRSLSVEDVSQKALAYGMARDRFDGDDVIRVRDRIAEAVRRARNESQPTLIEVRTLPLPRPLDVRPGPVPHQGRGRGVEEAGLPLHRASSTSRSWASNRRSSIAIEEDGQGRGRGRGEVRRGEPGARRRPPRTSSPTRSSGDSSMPDRSSSEKRSIRP